MKWPRTCLFCKHFTVWSAEQGYSTWTPGSDMDIECGKSRWDIDNYEANAELFRREMLRGIDCPDFEDSHEDNSLHYRPKADREDG